MQSTALFFSIFLDKTINDFGFANIHSYEFESKTMNRYSFSGRKPYGTNRRKAWNSFAQIYFPRSKNVNLLT